MNMKQKQRWIPVNLIKRAEDLARYIRKGQERGEFYQYPINLKSSQLLVMALAIGLKKIAEDVGYSWEHSEKEKEKKPPEEKRKDRDFLEKLMGGLG